MRDPVCDIDCCASTAQRCNMGQSVLVIDVKLHSIMASFAANSVKSIPRAPFCLKFMLKFLHSTFFLFSGCR